MAGATTHGGALYDTVVYLAAALVCVPLFARLKIGAIIGYIAAGLLIGPHVLGVVADTEAISSLAELGVVMVMFVIGLELRPARLWALRRDIFGLGTAQVVLTGLILVPVATAALDLNWRSAIIVGFSLALSSTAFALQLYKERGTLNTPGGERAFAILLLQDMALVPLLALVSLLAGAPSPDAAAGWQTGLVTLGAVGGVVLVGRYGLPWLFDFIVASGVRELLTAAALFIVVGTAALMASIGLSMALGAFIAGVVLADSEFRHQLEADIEPFRGLLLGLFFISVGSGLTLPVLMTQPVQIASVTLALLFFKIAVLYALTRVTGSKVGDAREIATSLAQSGEFGFVLFAAAQAGGLLKPAESSVLGACITLSMLLTPLLSRAVQIMGRKTEDGAEVGPSLLDRERKGRIILSGYGRFGQVVAQMLLARGLEVTLIDSDPARIRLTRQFGQTVYFGNGWRVDVLRAAGAESAQMLILCGSKDRTTAEQIQRIKREFPSLEVLVRVKDRAEQMELMKSDADFLIRELFESALAMGREALRRIGLDASTIETIETEFRIRDETRLTMQAETGDLFQGRELIFRADNPLASTVFDIGPTDEADDQIAAAKAAAPVTRRKSAKVVREMTEDDGIDQTGWS